MYAKHDVTWDHVICRSFRTLIHENLRRNFQKYMKIYREIVFKDCKTERLQVFSQDFKQAVQDCKELQVPGQSEHEHTIAAKGIEVIIMIIAS